MAKRAHGEGSMYRAADGYWHGSINLGSGPDGRRLRRHVRGRTQGEVKKKLDESKSGIVIGDCDVEARPDGYLNVMYAVFPRWRGHGVATRAARLLIRYAAQQFPGHTPLFRIHPGNEASIAVARRCGAAPSGSELSANGRELVQYTVNHSTASA